MKYLILSLVLLTGCSGSLVKPGLHVNPEFIPHLEQFHKEAKANNRLIIIENLTIKFDGKLNDTNILAECEHAYYPIISFRPSFWDNASEEDRENVMFHELGHCILNLDHDEERIRTINNESIAKSIMYPWPLDGNVYLRYRSYYIIELFNKQP